MVDLTFNQRDCLSAASLEKPIYAENPSHVYSQMPQDARCFLQRTVDSLAGRGLLVSNARGGYLLTALGAQVKRQLRI